MLIYYIIQNLHSNIIVFSLDCFMERAACELLRPPIFFNDASFDTPKGFYQYDFLGFKCPLTKLSVPCFFALMTGKSEENYKTLYKMYSRIIEDNIGEQLKVGIVKSDMEKARINAWRS